jgi:hypothetical protein
VSLWQDLESLLGTQVDVLSDRGVSPHLRERMLAEPFLCERRARLPASRDRGHRHDPWLYVDGRDAFFADRKTPDAVVRNIEIIGQAVKGISDETRGSSPKCRGGRSRGARQAHPRILRRGPTLFETSSSVTCPKYVQSVRL